MKSKVKLILFITSFVPVIAFKVIARVGEATSTQAKLAALVGLALAALQLILSRKIIHHTTYLEKAFLGFLAIGTGWLFLTPPHVSSILIENSTTLLYFVLFLTTQIPQLFGYDPFTYAIAKQMTPEHVWNTPQFRVINLHLTYFWSCIFLVASLLCWLGQGKPLFSIVLPLLLVVGIGLPVVNAYPRYYLKKEFVAQSVDPALFPGTAREFVMHMPMGFDPAAGQDMEAEIQFDLSGKGGIRGVLSISKGQCSFREGASPTPTLAIHSPADIWLKVARREINPAQALMDGLYRVEGDMNLLIKMKDLFHPPTRIGEGDLEKKGEQRC